MAKRILRVSENVMQMRIADVDRFTPEIQMSGDEQLLKAMKGSDIFASCIGSNPRQVWLGTVLC